MDIWYLIFDLRLLKLYLLNLNLLIVTPSQKAWTKKKGESVVNLGIGFDVRH